MCSACRLSGRMIQKGHLDPYTDLGEQKKASDMFLAECAKKMPLTNTFGGAAGSNPNSGKLATMMQNSRKRHYWSRWKPVSKDKPNTWVSQIAGHAYTEWGVVVHSKCKYQPSVADIRKAVEGMGKSVNSQPPTAGNFVLTVLCVLSPPPFHPTCLK